MDRYVFPGSSGFVADAASELGLDVNPHDVNKIPAFRTLVLLASQASPAIDSSEVLAAADKMLAVLQTAELAARKAIESVRAAIEPPKPAKPAKTGK